MFRSIATAAVLMGALVMGAQAEDVLKGKMKNVAGEEVDLASYKGKVVLAVNVASQCGYTKQYEQLEALNDKYAEKGLKVVGFPCNQFGSQEPGTEVEILKFCKDNYDVSFDLMSKVDVNGDNATPLYKKLTAIDAKPAGKGKIAWNFEKFVIGKDGEVIARFPSATKPDAPEVLKAIEAALAK